eukprot:SAG11_NODE_11233_length_774_cov_3.684444_1_plen_78_part_00
MFSLPQAPTLAGLGYEFRIVLEAKRVPSLYLKREWWVGQNFQIARSTLLDLALVGKHVHSDLVVPSVRALSIVPDTR